MNRSLVLKKQLLLFALALMVLTGPVFSASKKNSKKKASAETAADVQSAIDLISGSTESVKLPSEKRTFFYKIDQEILDGVENGSPSSIKKAVSQIKKTEAEYAENERVLSSVAAEIMRICWPSQKVTWEVYEPAQANPYTGAIKSARNGIFDSSTGNVDFLTTVLPALVVLVTDIPPQALSDCENAVLGALRLRPDSVLANYLAGVVLQKKQDYARSESYMERAYSSATDCMELALAYSDVLAKNGKLELAKNVLGSVASENVANVSVLKQNAYLSFEAGDLAGAEEYVARVLQQTPNDLEFVLFRTKILIEKNDYIHAVSLLDMYARQNDTSLDYLILRARVQLDWSKNTSAATETIEKALQLYPQSDEALLLAARLSSVTDSPVAGKFADELASIVLERSPDNHSALVYALDGLVQRENWAEAYEISRQLLAEQPDDPEVVFRHVSICLSLSKKQEAFSTAEAAYNANKTDETIMQAYVYAYTQNFSRDDSIALVNRLLASSTSRMKSYLYYRRSFLQRGEDAALADLRSSLIANPRNSDALFRLYEIYFAKSDYRKAQYYLRQVVAINPNDSSIRKLNDALTQLIQ